MGGMKTTKPKQPRVVRMPVEEDPATLAAADRAKAAALKRRGRASTIMTETGRERTGGNAVIGSSGKQLGA